MFALTLCRVTRSCIANEGYLYVVFEYSGYVFFGRKEKRRRWFGKFLMKCVNVLAKCVGRDKLRSRRVFTFEFKMSSFYTARFQVHTYAFDVAPLTAAPYGSNFIWT